MEESLSFHLTALCVVEIWNRHEAKPAKLIVIIVVKHNIDRWMMKAWLRKNLASILTILTALGKNTLKAKSAKEINELIKNFNEEHKAT
ncbi:MAG: hypothetical protein ABSE15_11495 [Candidatus Bathyarchaeia archaeon]